MNIIGYKKNNRSNFFLCMKKSIGIKTPMIFKKINVNGTIKILSI